jgi:xylono-1,5-lactonase
VWTIDPGLPDGLVVDLDGSIWVAVWGGVEVRRFDRTGKLTGIIPMPVTQSASCAFGHDGALYIPFARNGLSPQDLACQPRAGSVFALRTNTLGVSVRAFAA